MRVKISLHNSEGISLPVQYNYHILSTIYSLLPGKKREFWHEKGFMYGKRHFKLFTFSMLKGKKIRTGNMLHFDNSLFFYISSPKEEFISDVTNGLVKKQYIEIAGQKLFLSGIEFIRVDHFKSPVKIKTLSPITVYSTFVLPDKKKKTYFYPPTDPKFSELVANNAVKKYTVLYGKEPNNNDFSIKAVKFRKSVRSFKNGHIMGWSGTFMLNGNVDIIKTVYDTGLGSKNSDGFGMFEILGENK